MRQLPVFSAIAEYNLEDYQPKHKEIVERVPASKGAVSGHTQTLLKEQLILKENRTYRVDQDTLWGRFTTFFDENLRQDEEEPLPDLNALKRHVAANEDQYYELVRNHFENHLLESLASARQNPRIKRLADVFRDVERSIHDYAWLNADNVELLALSLTTYHKPPYDTNDEAPNAMRRVEEELL